MEYCKNRRYILSSGCDLLIIPWGKIVKLLKIRYDYFNLDDSQIFRDHEPLIAPAPHCGDHEHFYYKEKKAFFLLKKEGCV